ncbi:cryptococcal mannosyltransferase 1-domain-containing protein [Truncatella angustata]|uniref:Cryptococcal mannosyltransferase 1-domain-containing protein n=1 Tax=Truncatella angustata TaxID=152316 RepID=A0A9P8U885_9PEZI|nr:cryptococcal mannosyltransferase 1-domain-containing protein [Truncatella angustata]KAH6644944.1 cryptococcal mannosyltransferase 1-domain-containing protein [Truncatella angustata]
MRTLFGQGALKLRRFTIILRRITRRNPVVFTLVKYVLIALFSVLIATPVFAPSYTHLPPHYRGLVSRCSGPGFDQGGCANPFNEKVFISVSLYDKNGHLADGKWGELLLRLIHMIGAENVFLSIYENDSGPGGASALEHLQTKLSCRHKIVNDAHVPIQDFPTIRMPDGTNRVKRISYLSEMRNRALRLLDRLNKVELGTARFDKILFLNDVIFNPTDAANLLFSTNIGADGRAHYLSVCALDFIQPLQFYDLYAQRDAEGFSGGLPIYPFFSTEGQGVSRAAVLGQSDAVPVKSCWGGMVAMQAKYVQNTSPALSRPHFQDSGSHVIDPDAPTNVTSPVRFRYEPEVFFDACECCLFLADVTQVAKSQGADELGTYVNPYIRTAYTEGVFKWLSWVRRWERLLIVPQWAITKLVGLPTHNPHRTVQQGQKFMEEVWVGPGPGKEDNGQSPGHWQLVERTGRNGMFCGVREMQLVLQSDRSEDINWENTRMPAGQFLKFPT